MRTIMLFLLIANFWGAPSVAEQQRVGAFNGIWFCETVNDIEAYRARRSVLVVRDNEFLMVTGTGVANSTFTTDEQSIDIQRYDGRSQPGIFQVDGPTLHLSLGDADGVRPTHYGHQRGEIRKPEPPHSHYRFVRSPTPEGLEVLRRALNDENKRSVIFAGYKFSSD